MFTKVCLKHLKVICVRPFLVALPYFADSCFNEINQNVNDLVFRDKVE